MSDPELTEALEQFLRASIDNHDQLLVLLLVHAQPAHTFVSPELAAELRCDERVVSMATSRLAERGLVQVDGLGVRAGDRLPRELLGELVRLHDERPRALQEFLVGLATERLRVRNIVSFAEAFKLRGGKKDG